MQAKSYDFVTRHGRNDPVLIMPVGDIQWSGEKGDTVLGMLQRHIEWGVERGAWFLGMGDYIDFASPSNRQRLTSAALYDSALDVIGDKAHELTSEIFNRALKPSKGRWLGLLEGHHFYQLKDGTTTDMRLCEMLDAPFLGTSAFVRLRFGRRNSNSTGNVSIYCHHGTGQGQRAGSPLNKLDTMAAYFDADIILMGHVTKKVGAPLDRISCVWAKNGPRLIHKTVLIAATGGFSRSYQLNRLDGSVPRGNYVEQKMMVPAALGGIVVRVTPEWRQFVGDADLLWHPDIKIEL
jgi:hypothetical protein